MTTEAPTSSFTYDGLAAIIPFPAVFPLVCQACQQYIKEAVFKRDIIRHSKICRQRPANAQLAKDTIFECTHCGFRAADRRKATTHQASHFEDPEYNLHTYPCSQCNKTFATQKALSSHSRQCKNTLPRVQPNMNSASMTSQQLEEVPAPEPTHLEPVRDLDIDVPDIVEEDSFSEMSFVTIDIYEDEDYQSMPTDLQTTDIDDWMGQLLPPKNKTKKTHQQPISSKLSALDLQKLYNKDMKKAINKIQFTPNISCEVDGVDLRYGLLTQLSTTNRVHDVEGLWSPCIEGRNELSRRFTAEEFGPSLKHKNSAAGPDGWTYSELGRKKDFATKFVKGVHWMATNGTTPESWKRYNSLMLFKKPDEYVPGQEKVL